MSRPIQILEKPDLPPYRCIYCSADSTSDRKYFVDTGIDADWEGVIYLCNSCITHIAVTVGFLTKERSDELLGYQMDTVAAYYQLKEKLDRMHSTWTKLTGYDLNDFFDNLEKVEHLGKLSRQYAGNDEDGQRTAEAKSRYKQRTTSNHPSAKPNDHIVKLQ